MLKLLVCDDEIKYTELLKDIFEDEGFEVVTANDGKMAIEEFKGNSDIDLVVLDVMMPGLSGIEVLKKIRKASNIPVMMLTALSEDEDELKGLVNGANDYVKKPFCIDVLIARVKNLLKDKFKDRIKVDNIVIDKKLMEIFNEGIKVDFTPREYKLFFYLFENKNCVLERNQILDKVWGIDYYGDVRTIDSHIRYLRAKLGEFGKRIKTKRGMGYVLVVDENEIN